MKLHEITDHYLLGGGRWPIGRESLPAFWETLDDLGLEEQVPGEPGVRRNTALAKELQLDLMIAFVGAHELFEIPMILEENGYLNEEEADALLAMPAKQFERALHRYVLRAYLQFCNRSKLLN